MFCSDGTPSGTGLCDELYPGPATSGLCWPGTPFATLGTEAFFYACTAPSTYGFFRSNGTVGNVSSVAGNGFMSPYEKKHALIGSTWYFSGGVNLGATGFELSKVTSASGAELITDINPGPSNSSPDNLTALGSLLLFAADDGTNGKELWKRDELTTSTSMVKNIKSVGGSNPTLLTTVGSTTFFIAADDSNAINLYKTDGSTVGTLLVKSLANTPWQMYALGSLLVFFVDDGINGFEPWISDGTLAGTQILKDIYPGATGSGTNSASVANGKLLFNANDGVNGLELWATDGTSSGTLLLKDIYPGPIGSRIDSMVTHLGRVFYRALDPVKGFELGVSDGSSDATYLLDIIPGKGYSDPSIINAMDNKLYILGDLVESDTMIKIDFED